MLISGLNDTALMPNAEELELTIGVVPDKSEKLTRSAYYMHTLVAATTECAISPVYKSDPTEPGTIYIYGVH